MMIGAYRDVIDSPIMAPYLEHWRRAADIVASAWGVGRRERVRLRAVICHALSFPTWRSLVRDQKLSDAEALNLMLRLTCDCEPTDTVSSHKR